MICAGCGLEVTGPHMKKVPGIGMYPCDGEAPRMITKEDVAHARAHYFASASIDAIDTSQRLEDFVRAVARQELEQLAMSAAMEPSVYAKLAFKENARDVVINKTAAANQRADEAEATCAAVVQEFQALIELLKTAGRKLLESHRALREERDKLSSQLESQHARSMGLADQLRELCEAAAGLVESLPKCTFCNAVATRAFQRGRDRYCDKHGTEEALLTPVPEYPRAPWIRKVADLLGTLHNASPV